MIFCSEHEDLLISSLSENERAIIGSSNIQDKIFPGMEKSCAFAWSHGPSGLTLSTSYFIGTDWLVPGQIPIHVHSKLDTSISQLNYLEIFSRAFHALNALPETQRGEWLRNLFYIDFQAPRIPCVQKGIDGLQLFLIVLFIQSLTRIVKKGLKRSFYVEAEEFKNKIKGRVQMNHTLASQWNRPVPATFHCLPQEFGLDNSENQILKKALALCINRLDRFQRLDPDKMRFVMLRRQAQWCMEAFGLVSSVHGIRSILRSFKINPVYKTYAEALSLAKQLFARCNYNISLSDAEEKDTPPYWINMPKLFELFVCDKLREAVGPDGKVEYQQHIHYQILDFLCNSECEGWEAFIADAKYKPDYKRHGLGMDDARQVCGYARLSKSYEFLKVKDRHSNIRCLIVYPDGEAADTLNLCEAKVVNGYEDVYKIGVKLPMIRYT